MHELQSIMENVVSACCSIQRYDHDNPSQVTSSRGCVDAVSFCHLPASTPSLNSTKGASPIHNYLLYSCFPLPQAPGEKIMSGPHLITAAQRTSPTADRRQHRSVVLVYGGDCRILSSESPPCIHVKHTYLSAPLTGPCGQQERLSSQQFPTRRA